MTSDAEHEAGPAGVSLSRYPGDAQQLRETYAAIADGRLAVRSSCCASGAAAAPVPSGPEQLSLGCGDPVSLATLAPGQTVLDLGCGAGGDCFRAAEQVGEFGWVIGVDVTPEMLDRARGNQRRLGLSNVEFRVGEIQHLPVADQSVDVVLSNCVINLTPDRPQVFREAYRVLKHGGTLALSDVLTDGPVPGVLKDALGPLARGVCVERDYLAAIEAAGFVDVQVTRTYVSLSAEEASALAEGGGSGARAVVRVGETGETRVVDLDPAAVQGGAMRSFNGSIRARKPTGMSAAVRRETGERSGP